MCLTKPAKIKKVKGLKAELADGRKVNLAFTEKIKKGDWVLANANLAVSKVSDKEVKEINEYLKI
ncbi:MAG: HypC/HybG/HupF family hydrogenase formation chaperone [Patescibacteria group bacterium]|jgi:hydrogenase maturation factor